MSESIERKKKSKKHRKEKKDKKHKKEKKSKKEKKQKKGRSRSRSRSRATERRERLRDKEIKSKEEYERREVSRFDMDPNKAYNQDWNKSKLPEEDKEGEDSEFKSYYQQIEQYKEIRNGIQYNVYKDQKRTLKHAVSNSAAPIMIEVIVNDRMGRKQRIKCMPSDTIKDFKRLISAQVGTRADKIRLQKSTRVFKDHITLDDYEVHHGSCLDMYYN